MTELFPDAQCGIGPPTEDGFFYDFLVAKPFTPEDLVAIEKKMAHIVKQNRPIEKKLLPKAEALELFAKQGQTLKCELIAEKSGDPVQCYTMGEFVDFCLGPHLASTKDIKAFKLKAEPAAAYWKGKEGNPSMQRIYGYAFFTKEELDQHLFRIEEAKRRDHRKLGRELDLFSIADETGAGLVLWHPKGGFVRKQIEDYWRDEHLAGGYDLVYSPHIARLDLWKTSGHTEYYKANMYSPMEIENVEYQLKPMNCPFHLTIYKSRLRSYRDLPMRWAELGTVYRYERSGVLHGLHAGARLHAGRRAHLLPARPARGRDPARARLHDEHPPHLRLRPLRHLPLDEAGEGERERTSSGTSRRRRCARRSRRAACRTRWTRARASSTGPRSTSRSRTRSTAPGSARPSRWTSTTRRGSSSSTSPRTARRTSR